MGTIRTQKVYLGGEEEKDLYYDKSRDVWYFFIKDEVTGRKIRVCRRKKTAAALALYNYKLQFMEQKAVSIPVKDAQLESKAYPLNVLTQQSELKIKALVGTVENVKIPENIILEEFVKLLDSNPRKVAETFVQMGREDLSAVVNLPKNYKLTKTKLSDMLEWYLTNEERSKDTIKYAKLFWNQFCNLINVPFLEQITLERLKAYKSAVEAKQKTEKRSKRWAGSRYEYIKRIIKHSILHVSDSKDIQQVLGWCDVLKANGKKGEGRLDPKPISPFEFQALLNHVTDELHKAKSFTKRYRYSKWRAVLLTAANTCSYFSDLCDMKFVARAGELGLDLEHKTLAMYREKTSVPKIAVLWDETVQAIKEFRAIAGTTSEFVFATQKNKQNLASHLRDEYWKHIRPDTEKMNPEMRTGIEFNEIRDACFSACASEHLGLDQRNMISGHKGKGDDDAYLLREPSLAEPASKACWKYFMDTKVKFTVQENGTIKLEKAI